MKLRKAVTITELAACTFAGVVLIACAAGSTAAVRRTNKDARCLLNLSQTGLASSVYSAQDPGDMALPVHGLQFQQDEDKPTFIGAYEWGGKSGIGWDNWFGSSNPLNSKYGTRAGFGPATRPLNAILYRESFADNLNPVFNPAGALEDTQLNLDVQHCPADTGYSGIHFPTFRDSKLSSFDHFGTSYTANVFSFGFSGGGPVTYNSPYLRPLSDVKSPATTVLYYENNGRYAWSAGPTPDQCDFIGPKPPGPIRGWHGKYWMFNAAFVDGRVDTIYMRAFRNSILPYSPDSMTSPEQASEQYRCVMIRGDGWQLDTLPASPIDGGIDFSFSGRPSWEHGIE